MPTLAKMTLDITLNPQRQSVTGRNPTRYCWRYVSFIFNCLWMYNHKQKVLHGSWIPRQTWFISSIVVANIGPSSSFTRRAHTWGMTCFNRHSTFPLIAQWRLLPPTLSITWQPNIRSWQGGKKLRVSNIRLEKKAEKGWKQEWTAGSLPSDTFITH